MGGTIDCGSNQLVKSPVSPQASEEVRARMGRKVRFRERSEPKGEDRYETKGRSMPRVPPKKPGL